MLKKFFEGTISFIMWAGMQMMAFVIGYLASALIYEAVDDWMSEEWVLGAFFVALNIGVSMWKLWKRRVNWNK